MNRNDADPSSRSAVLAPLPQPLSAIELTLDPKPTAYFGCGKVADAGRIVQEIGAQRVMIVTDPFLASSAVVASVRASLEAAGLQVTVFGGVTANPTTTCIDEGSDRAAAVAAEALVAVGGGSSMDAAKGISLGAVNPERGVGLDYTTDFAHDALPVVAIPTTAGTGAEVNAFGVVTDVVAHRKFYVGHSSALARAAILDPELTIGLPPKATASTGMDAFIHGLESYLSLRANPYSDGIALQTMSTVSAYLPRAVRDGSDIEARSELLLASHVVGVGFSHTGLGLVHGIAHPLGGQFDIPHGLALCMVIGGVLRFNLAARRERLARVAFAIGVGDTSATIASNADAALAGILGLGAAVGMDARLSDFGVGEDDLASLAADALADAVTHNNPVRPEADDIIDILREAL